MTEPIEVADGIEVQDAFVNLNLGNASPGELVIYVEEHPQRESAYPVSADEEGDVWLMENDQGLMWGVKDGPVQPPANTSPYTRTTEVDHEALGTVDRVPHLSHVVANKQNNREPQSVISPRYYKNANSPRSIPTRVETVWDIIETYINGPLGSDAISKIWYDYEVKRDRHWRNLAIWAGKEDYREREDRTDDIVLVPESIYTWQLKFRDDVDDKSKIFEP